MSEVSDALDAVRRGEAGAADRLLPLVYDELRRAAAALLAAEPAGQTLEPTALVHEAYLRLAGDREFDHRGHFYAAAARAMRCILVDAARRRRAAKHGGGLTRHDAHDFPLTAPEPDEDLLALDAALDRLAALDPVKAQLVQLRYFAGLTVGQSAVALGVSPATAKRYWAYSRAWLFQQVANRDPEDS